MLELKEFVSQSLLQIFEGVKQAQSKTKEMNGSVAPNNFRMSNKEIPNHPSVIGYVHQAPVISVDFDVSITTQDTTKEKAGLGIFITVLALGGQVGSESIDNQLSRLRFSIPIILPAPEKQTESSQ